MSLVEIKWKPSRKELRSFGLIALIATTVVSSLLYFIKGLDVRWALLIVATGLVIFTSSFVSLSLTRIFYLGLTLITLPIGVAVSFILLAGFYFLMITPLALFFRIVGRDRLRRRFEPGGQTYWILRRPTERIDRYFHQF